jgi:hypothetical protein
LSKRLNWIGALAVMAAALATALHSQGIAVPNTFVNGTVADATQVNANFAALASSALNRNAGTMLGTLTSRDLIPTTDATYDVGSGATRFRDGFFSRDLTLGRNLAVTGTTTLTGNVIADLVFLDNTYDIGKSGATRPRDGFFARNLTVASLIGAGADIQAGRNFIGPNMFAAGNTGAGITLRFDSNGAIQSTVRNANTTITFINAGGAGFYTLKLIHDGTAGAYTTAFSPTPKWPSGTTPAWTNTANAVDVLTLFWDGTTLYGSAALNMQ